MRIVAVVTPFAALLVLATCGSNQRPGNAEQDGEPCRSEAASTSKRVFVEIAQKAAGVFEARPDTCRVTAGTVITWRTAEGVNRPFSIGFKGQSAAGADAPRQVRSQGDPRPRITITAANKPGRYDYDVIVDGAAVDPAVIIEPR